MSNQNSRLIISYLTLRKLIGFLGLTFPIILIFGGLLVGVKIQSSVSYYYHTEMHDIFVAVLCVVATFLFAYKGYEYKDEIAGKVASICAVGIALIPTTIKTNPTEKQELLGAIHLVFATGYFLMIAYFCLFLFSKSNQSTVTKMKLQRNMTYRSCAYVILVCLILIGIYSFLPTSFTNTVEHLNPIFWLESVAIMAFGFAWLVKGEAIMKDEVASRN